VKITISVYNLDHDYYTNF